MYQTYYPSILYGTAEYFYQLAMTYRIEKAFKVEVDYIYITFTHYLLRLTESIMATPLGTEPVTCLGKLTLVYQRQHLVYGLLHQSVYHCGDS